MKNQKILVIDDSQASLLLTKIIFQEYKNAEVIMEEKSTNAMSIIKELNPDLIFMDILMPEIDGIELLKSIKQHPVHKNIPIVILSAKNCKQTEEEVLQAGAAAFQSKPVDIDEIKTLAESLINLKK